VLVDIARRDSGKRFASRKLKKIAEKILEVLEQGSAELSLVLVGNDEIRKLNRKFRGKDYATDVLSFPVENDLPGPEQLLGDVIISVEKAREQAKERGRTFDEEMVTLLIHGVVHLLGYDHERSAKDAKAMTRLEKRIYRALCEQGILSV
jgi:probable rRNA maturation factor